MNYKIFIIIIIIFSIQLVNAIPQTEYSNVLIVTNTNSQDSIDISNAFMLSRNVTKQVNITVSTSESVSFSTFNTSIRQPIETYLNTNGITSIDYIVLTKGIPIRYNADSNCRVSSIDSALTIILSKYNSSICVGTSTFAGRTVNPMFNNISKANKTYYDIYIVTRLDGYTKEDVIKLFNNTNNSVNVTSGGSRYLLDSQPSKTGGYATWNNRLYTAQLYLNTSINISGIFDNTTTFKNNTNNLTIYYSWGSNDGGVASTSNSSQWNFTFKYGSIADTAVSTSGRSFLNTTTYGQSLIADLIKMNVTFVKGYTNEPYLSAISYPEVVSNRYYTNYTVAESMYMGSKYINWMDVYIGDPKVINIDLKMSPITNGTEDINSTCASDTIEGRYFCDVGGCYYIDTNCEKNNTNILNRRFNCSTSSCSSI